MVEEQVDPMEPPKFKTNKKNCLQPAQAPAPVIRPVGELLFDPRRMIAFWWRLCLFVRKVTVKHSQLEERP